MLDHHRLISGVASEACRASGSEFPDHGRLGEGRELTIMESFPSSRKGKVHGELERVAFIHSSLDVSSMAVTS
jgi:hypothetical protein